MINENFKKYLAGFFDGDGSVFKIKHPAAKRDYIGINFTGTKNFLIELQKNINKILGKEYGYMRELKIKSGFYYQLVYSGDATIKKFIDWIYTDSNESNRLKRKYDLSQEYFSNLDFIRPQRETFTKSTSKNNLLKFNNFFLLFVKYKMNYYLNFYFFSKSFLILFLIFIIKSGSNF